MVNLRFHCGVHIRPKMHLNFTARFFSFQLARFTNYGNAHFYEVVLQEAFIKLGYEILPEDVHYLPRTEDIFSSDVVTGFTFFDMLIKKGEKRYGIEVRYNKSQYLNWESLQNTIYKLMAAPEEYGTPVILADTSYLTRDAKTKLSVEIGKNAKQILVIDKREMLKMLSGEDVLTEAEINIVNACTQ